MVISVQEAEFAGACYGVQRALDMAQKAIDDALPVTSFGPLIHNPIVVSRLEQDGIRVAESLDEIDTDAVLIRSHGITSDLRSLIDERGFTVVDATCPYVLRAQKASKRLAASHDALVIVGQGGHPEVEALEAYGLLSNSCVIVVSCADELPGDLPADVGVVVQTTQTSEALDDVLTGLRARGCAIELSNTICTATMQRQNAAAELARRVDAMVVIGGRNSANTTRLAEICSQAGAMTYHVESKDELRPEWFANCSSVGVTAGASTPQSQIDEVTAVLSAL